MSTPKKETFTLTRDEIYNIVSMFDFSNKAYMLGDVETTSWLNMDVNAALLHIEQFNGGFRLYCGLIFHILYMAKEHHTINGALVHDAAIYIMAAKFNDSFKQKVANNFARAVNGLRLL